MALLALAMSSHALLTASRAGVLRVARPALRAAPCMEELAEAAPATPELPMTEMPAPAAAVVPDAAAVVPDAADDMIPRGLIPDGLIPEGLGTTVSTYIDALKDATSTYIDGDYLLLIMAFTVLPISLFIGYIFLDGTKELIRLGTGKKSEPIVVSGPLAAEAEGEPSVWAKEAEDGSFDSELSAWPVILQLKRELEAMPEEEARRTKLEVGTNWRPRTSTAAPFAHATREGFMFFQGPTPRTAVQEGMPSFFSADNFRGLEVPRVLLASAAIFGAAFLVVAVSLVLG